MTLEIAEKIATKRGWQINPDRHYAQDVIDGLNALKEKWGHYYCPCKRVTGDPERDKDVRCPCKTAQKEIDEHGKCHCQLYTR